MKVIDSLGFIEVMGFVAGIEAADAMLKSASVRLLRQHEVHPGLVTLVIEGDLAACRAAINAGTAAASRVGIVLGSHVIGRPDGDTESMVLSLIPQSLDDYKGSGSLNNDAASEKSGVASNTENLKSKDTQTVVAKASVNSQSNADTEAAKPEEKVIVNEGTTQPAVLALDPVKVENKDVDLAKEVTPSNKPEQAKAATTQIHSSAHSKTIEQKSVAQNIEPTKAQVDALNKDKTLADIEAKAAQTDKVAASVESKKPTSQTDQVAPSVASTNQLVPTATSANNNSKVSGDHIVGTAASTQSELDRVMAYILLSQRGYTWAEISKHFPKLSRQLKQKLDQAVSSGKIIKVGARYCKPNKE